MKTRCYKAKETHDLQEALILALLLLSGWEMEIHEGLVGEACSWRSWKGHPYASLDLLEDLGLIISPRATKTLFVTDRGLERARQIVKVLEPLKIETLLD